MLGKVHTDPKPYRCEPFSLGALSLSGSGLQAHSKSFPCLVGFWTADLLQSWMSSKPVPGSPSSCCGHKMSAVDTKCQGRKALCLAPTKGHSDSTPLPRQHRHCRVTLTRFSAVWGTVWPSIVFSLTKLTFPWQQIFYPSFLDEDCRIRENCLSKLHYQFQKYSSLPKTVQLESQFSLQFSLNLNSA